MLSVAQEGVFNLSHYRKCYVTVSKDIENYLLSLPLSYYVYGFGKGLLLCQISQQNAVDQNFI